MMHEPEKSDSVVVAVKLANKTEQSVTEPVEPRTGTKGNANQQSTRRAQDRESVSQALERVRLAARRGKKEKFTSLLHHVDPEMLRTSFYALKRDAAPGVDGMTWDIYEQGLDRRIEDPHLLTAAADIAAARFTRFGQIFTISYRFFFIPHLYTPPDH
jgi:RNA-directed DNA polymerase